MKRPVERHYTEEELLVHMLGESTEDVAAGIDRHVTNCSECAAVLDGHREFSRLVSDWQVPQLSPATWDAQRARLLEIFRRERRLPFGAGLASRAWGVLVSCWDYALENPLPTLGYIAAAMAFASERTITIFRLDRILPATAELLEILRQAF